MNGGPEGQERLRDSERSSGLVRRDAPKRFRFPNAEYFGTILAARPEIIIDHKGRIEIDRGAILYLTSVRNFSYGRSESMSADY